MKRWIIATCLVSACQADDPMTSVAEQALTDCTPGGNYLDAKLPPLAPWAGKTPAAKPGQMYLDYRDPRTQGVYLAFLVDPGAGKIVWGATVKESAIAGYRATIDSGVDKPRLGDCCRPPPPPPGDGDNWLARFTLEAALRFAEVSAEAEAAANITKLPHQDPDNWSFSTPDLSKPGALVP
jgi:hypothetical protein